ncbi:MAG: class D beta-lactamase [Melioribacteraceae bacterium]|nr:MAG: class D beta-lactamase [Melioribacteraceae bacterium]
MKINFTILFFIFTLKMFSQNIDKDISQIFNDYDAAFVLYDYNNQKFIKHNPERCAERFLPASTFKIPNSLIGLETGIIKDAEFVIPWDSVKTWNPVWNKDHTLRSAVQTSCVPYFRELARRIGREKSQHYLNIFDYGNKTIGEKEDFYWLDNSLKISADEQIIFLKKFYENKLSVSQRNIDLVKEMIIIDSTENYILRAKTGGGEKEDGKFIGWYVGYLETKSNIYLFALNIDAETFEEMAPSRKELTTKVFKQLEIIPEK